MLSNATQGGRIRALDQARLFAPPRFRGLDEQMKVFELNELTMQRFKVERVKVALRSFSKDFVFIPIDFTREKLEAKPVPSLYDGNLETLFIWEVSPGTLEQRQSMKPWLSWPVIRAMVHLLFWTTCSNRLLMALLA